MRENYKFIVAVYVLFEKDNKVLLLRRHNTGWANGWYTLPAGHVEKGESFVDAAIREAKEEVGVSILAEDINLFYVSHNVYNKDEQCIGLFFKAKKWQGDFSNVEPQKCDVMEWHLKTFLPSKLLRNVRAALNNTANLNLIEFPFVSTEDMAIEK